MHQKNYVLHLTTNSRVMNPKENPYFPEYYGERVDYFHHHRNTAQQLSSPLLQKLLEAVCKGRQDMLMSRNSTKSSWNALIASW